MYSKSDFTTAIANTVNGYPSIAPLYNAADPRIMQNIDAMATMLAMLSSQIETALAEPFDKTRNATVLADAAIRGIIPKARSAQVSISLTNNSTDSYEIDADRILTDSVGNQYTVQTPVTVAAGATGNFNATQVYSQDYNFTVAGSVPFYAIQIPSSIDGSYLAAIDVRDADGYYTWANEYVNVNAGDRVFHVESDDNQNVYVRFGYDGVVGYQPPDGTVITLTVYWSVGLISLPASSPFALQYVQSLQESSFSFALNSVIDPGANPIDIATLRDFARYPSVYDTDSVFLGEFDFLVRRSYSDAQFLSVWNETIEEGARGASVNNINKLFVAFLSAAGGETILFEPNPLSPVAPTVISSPTASQLEIVNLIGDADDSYQVVLYTPVKSFIAMVITASVSTSYVDSEVKSQINSLIMSNYGPTSPAASHANQTILNQQVFQLLIKNIPALTDGAADFSVAITPYAGAYRPELWRYVDSTSLTINVTTTNITTAGWRG